MGVGQKKILVTGSTGFVGSAVVSRLLSHGKFQVVAVVRKPVSLPRVVKIVPADLQDDNACLERAVSGVEVVIHTAARVHVMEEGDVDPLWAYRSVNVNGTLNLARQAAFAGVKRFVFISSVKVNGEFTRCSPFREDDVPGPTDPYAISKLEAENALMALSQETDMDVVIIRPPLVYGPGVKANFFRLMEWLYRGVPLPLGAIHNRRSFIYLHNLVDLISICIEHPAAANQIFLCGDGESLSTTQLLLMLGESLGKRARLLPVPQMLLSACLKILGKGDIYTRLCCSLEVDITKARTLLGWKPAVPVGQGVEDTARWFLENCK